MPRSFLFEVILKKYLHSDHEEQSTRGENMETAPAQSEQVEDDYETPGLPYLP